MDFDKHLEALRRRHVLHIDDKESDTPPEAITNEHTNDVSLQPEAGNVLLYQTDDENISVSVYFYEETFWLNIKAMSELFDCSINNIAAHLKNIFNEKELDEISTTQFFEIVQKEGN